MRHLHPQRASARRRMCPRARPETGAGRRQTSASATARCSLHRATGREVSIKQRVCDWRRDSKVQFLALNGFPVFVIVINFESISDHIFMQIMHAETDSFPPQLAHKAQTQPAHHLLFEVEPTHFRWGMISCFALTPSMELTCATVNWHLHFYQSMSASVVLLAPASSCFPSSASSQ